jgi:hypothetical protein
VGPRETSTAKKQSYPVKRRSQRVLIEIPVLVYGHLRENEPFQAEALTVIVNSHGGLISTTMPLNMGQKLLLVHQETGKEVKCHVVHLETNKDGKPLIGIEFADPAPRFWNIHFPPEDWKPVERKLPETRRPSSGRKRSA